MPGKNLKTFADLQHDSIEKIRGEFGGKTFGLFTAYQLGIRVPETWIIGCEWFAKFYISSVNN